MSNISSISAASSSQFSQRASSVQPAPTRVSDPDHDGDNDAGVSKAQEAREQATAQSIRTTSGGIDTLA